MDKMTCPRRMNEWGPWEHEEGLDHWKDNRTCSFCGGLQPRLVLDLIKEGQTVTPTDKNYKGYITGSPSASGKFYFLHFNEDEGVEFTDLYNGRVMKIDVPGHFYVRPLFWKKVEKIIEAKQ